MDDAPAPKSRRRALVIVLLAVAAVAAIAFPLAFDSEEGSTAIDLVKRATAATLAEHRSQAEAAGGSLQVSWRAIPMTGGQMVEAVIRSSIPDHAGRALFMVESDSDEVMAQDRYSASLLGPGGRPMRHP